MADLSPNALHAHVGETLLPLLRRHLPHTVVVYGTIVAHAPAVRTAKAVDPECVLPPVYASFPPREDGGEITLDYLRSLGIGEYDWLLTVALPFPSEQIRIHHAIVAASQDEQTAGLDAANTLMLSALSHMADRYPGQLVVGNTHELFEPLVRKFTGSPRRHETYTYVAPDLGFGNTPLDIAGNDWEDSLLQGPGSPEDAELIYGTNPYRLTEYYATRSPYISVLRPCSEAVAQSGDRRSPPPIAWVMTHGDGSLGALWTEPAYRRRGLAKVILKSHLADQAKYGIPGFCYVEADNAASMALWESLGWQRMPWISYWMYVTSKTGQVIG